MIHHPHDKGACLSDQAARDRREWQNGIGVTTLGHKCSFFPCQIVHFLPATTTITPATPTYSVIRRCPGARRVPPSNTHCGRGLDHGVSHFRLCAVGCACSAGSRTACARLCHAGAAGAGAASAVPPQQGDRTMRTLGVPRSILLLLGVASILFSGCVSKGEYTALLEQYDTLAGP